MTTVCLTILVLVLIGVIVWMQTQARQTQAVWIDALDQAHAQTMTYARRPEWTPPVGRTHSLPPKPTDSEALAAIGRFTSGQRVGHPDEE